MLKTLSAQLKRNIFVSSTPYFAIQYFIIYTKVFTDIRTINSLFNQVSTTQTILTIKGQKRLISLFSQQKNNPGSQKQSDHKQKSTKSGPTRRRRLKPQTRKQQQSEKEKRQSRIKSQFQQQYQNTFNQSLYTSKHNYLFKTIQKEISYYKANIKDTDFQLYYFEKRGWRPTGNRDDGLLVFNREQPMGKFQMKLVIKKQGKIKEYTEENTEEKLSQSHPKDNKKSNQKNQKQSYKQNNVKPYFELTLYLHNKSSTGKWLVSQFIATDTSVQRLNLFFTLQITTNNKFVTFISSGTQYSGPEPTSLPKKLNTYFDKFLNSIDINGNLLRNFAIYAQNKQKDKYLQLLQNMLLISDFGMENPKQKKNENQEKND